MVTETKGSSRLGQAIAWGAGAGVVASIAMGVYAMVVMLIQDKGFFTPVHHIATLFASPEAMMGSMMSAMGGEGSFEISGGAAILGLVIHMMTGALYGVVFAAIVAQFDLKAALLAAAGLVYGFVVFLVSSFIGLPVAAAVFGVDDLAEGDMAGMNPIADMPEMAGWGTFVVEHLIFGLVLGLLLALRPTRRH